jgi:hypothetical protein
MKWQETEKVPDSTYFLTADAEPHMASDGTITLLNGRGTRRGWGAPQVNTTVLIDDCDFLAVLVGFSHKHGGSQFYRYYIPNGQGPKRVTWAKLTDDEREMVLGAYEAQAPYWAKRPGKLRSEYKKPKDTKFTAYKVMRQVADDEFLSLFNDTAWTLGKRNAEAVGDAAVRWAEHSGGFYVHKSAERIVELFESKQLVGGKRDEDAHYVLVECECGGRQAQFSSGKVACTYCTPVRIVQKMEVDYAQMPETRP